MRLVMSLLVKNESDIISDNIKVHAALGVDAFVVMDNGSTDGTREVVESLSKDYDIILIDRPTLDYQQSNWKTEMARVASKKLGADWVITNDADEFWIPKGNSLKEELTRAGSIVYCPRYNMLFNQHDFEQSHPYYEQLNRVQYSINYPKGIQQSHENLSIMMGNIHGKVMVRTRGLLRVKGGNHRAWHLWGWYNQKTSSNIKVYHFPIRSKSHFISNIENRKALLEKNITKMGDHYKRWVKMLNEGQLDYELNRLTLSPECKHMLTNLGIICEDSSARDKIKPILDSYGKAA